MRKFDTHGNYISSVEMVNGKTKFVLFLKESESTRELGILNKEKNCLEVKRNPNIHTYWKMDAYGFNDTLLRQLPPTCKVLVKQTGTHLKLATTVEIILTKGAYRFYKNEGFERQIFLRKSDFKIEI